MKKIYMACAALSALTLVACNGDGSSNANNSAAYLGDGLSGNVSDSHLNGSSTNASTGATTTTSDKTKHVAKH